MQFQWNVKYGIHIDFYMIVHFHLHNNHIVVWILPFQILWKWQEEVRLVCNYRNNANHLFWKEEKRGIILATFNLSGKIPVVNDWFNIKVSGEEINGLTSFDNIVETSSWPELCFAFNLLIFFTVCCSTSSKLKDFFLQIRFYIFVLVFWNLLWQIRAYVCEKSIKLVCNISFITFFSFIIK